MKRALPTALLLLAACHGQQGQGVTLDADEDARNATGAKIDADLSAADAAMRSPLPRVQTPSVDQADAATRPTAQEEDGPDQDDRTGDNDD